MISRLIWDRHNWTGKTSLLLKNVTLAGFDLGFENIPPSIAVNMGNPHAVHIVDDAEAIDLAAIGPKLEHHPIFPDRANIEFISLIAPDEIRMRVWERGAGITIACGTGACASAVAAARAGLTSRHVKVHLDGGMLDIKWREDGGVTMTGPSSYVFDGVIDLSHRQDRDLHDRERPLTPKKEGRPQIQTFGCRLNIWESEVITRHVDDAGLDDVIIVNTCASNRRSRKASPASDQKIAS